MKKSILGLLITTVIVVIGGCKGDKHSPFKNPLHHEHEVKPGWDYSFSEYICRISSMHILEFKSFEELNEVANYIATEIYNGETLDSSDEEKMYWKYYQYTYYDYKTFYDNIGELEPPYYDDLNNQYRFPSLYSFYGGGKKSIGGEEPKSKEEVEAIRLRYSYFFLFDTKDLTSTKPYLAMKNKNHAYVANIYGRVIVGGIEYNLNDCMTFDELPK